MFDYLSLQAVYKKQQYVICVSPVVFISEDETAKICQLIISNIILYLYWSCGRIDFIYQRYSG